MKKILGLMIVSLVAGLPLAGSVVTADAGSPVIQNKTDGHRIYVPAHWDEATQSYIYPEFITVKPHTPGHRHYAKRYRAVRVHEGMTFKRTRSVSEASFCDQPFESKTSKYRGKDRVFRVCP